MNSVLQENNDISLSLHPGNYKAAAAISFDYETSAQSPGQSFKSHLKTTYLQLRNKYIPYKREMSGRYGRGYASRLSAEKILKFFQEQNIHGTWFSTGHILLKENVNKKAYRINQKLPYATKAAGFTDATTWRQCRSSFYHEPFSNYLNHPWYYLGDQAERMRQMGEDIQCHTFSHPYVAMEPAEKFKIDLEDWQNAAANNGFAPANIFAFPFLGDYYLYYLSSGLQAIPIVRLKEEKYDEIGLKPEHIQILTENGIELLTRCGSKHNDPLFKGFIEYNNSGLFFMKDKGLLTFKTTTEFTDYLDLIIEGGYTIDFWLHPNDVYFEADYLRFKNMLLELIAKQKQNQIWFSTIKELWLRFKAIKRCQLKTFESNDIFKINIINQGSEILNNVALNIPNKFVPCNSNPLFTYLPHQIVVKKINPQESCEIKLKRKS